jgi:hypothetical protein
VLILSRAVRVRVCEQERAKQRGVAFGENGAMGATAILAHDPADKGGDKVPDLKAGRNLSKGRGSFKCVIHPLTSLHVALRSSASP